MFSFKFLLFVRVTSVLSFRRGALTWIRQMRGHKLFWIVQDSPDQDEYRSTALVRDRRQASDDYGYWYVS